MADDPKDEKAEQPAPPAEPVTKSPVAKRRRKSNSLVRREGREIGSQLVTTGANVTKLFIAALGAIALEWFRAAFGLPVAVELVAILVEIVWVVEFGWSTIVRMLSNLRRTWRNRDQ